MQTHDARISRCETTIIIWSNYHILYKIALTYLHCIVTLAFTSIESHEIISDVRVSHRHPHLYTARGYIPPSTSPASGFFNFEEDRGQTTHMYWLLWLQEINQAYTAQVLGHCGFQWTYQLFNVKHWWPSKMSHILKYVFFCFTCT